jgi:hypothetical protein
MFRKAISHIRNPWAWFISLITLGVALSIGASTKGQMVTGVQPHSSTNTDNGCVPIMERVGGGGVTGRMNCASEEQVRQLCEVLSVERRKKDADAGR